MKVNIGSDFVIRFVDYTFDKHGNLEYILLSVKDEINNSDTVE